MLFTNSADARGPIPPTMPHTSPLSVLSCPVLIKVTSPRPPAPLVLRYRHSCACPTAYTTIRGRHPTGARPFVVTQGTPATTGAGSTGIRRCKWSLCSDTHRPGRYTPHGREGSLLPSG